MLLSSCSHSLNQDFFSDTMSKSKNLKNLFKLKSHDKESKELKDEAATSPRDKSRTLPASSGPYSPGDSDTLAGDDLAISPKVKKAKRLLSFKLKRKKSKSKEDAGGEVFFPETDELDSFNK